MDFCFSPATEPPDVLCSSCPEVRTVYWDSDLYPGPVPTGKIYKNAELTIDGSIGFYRLPQTEESSEVILPAIYYSRIQTI
jgi:hypothetical protein